MLYTIAAFYIFVVELILVTNIEKCECEVVPLPTVNTLPNCNIHFISRISIYIHIYIVFTEYLFYVFELHLS